MKQSVIIEMSTAELIERIGEENNRLAELKMSHAVSQLENPMELRQMRKTIARLNTELTKRNAEQASN
ncbi:MAG: 50S ribosomal protein L29 [Flavobacteriales bacterium]|nr:50S ribosomal protein L29 [Flavobacteriales bacterium]